MLDHLDVAQREEARQARGLAEVAPEHLLVAGGCAGRGSPGTWVNNAVGLGLGGEVPASELDSLVDWYAGKGIEPRVELCPYADRSVVAGLASRGFVVRDWENVLYREISAREPARAVVVPPDNLSIVVIDPGDDGMVREYSRVSMSGFFPPGVEPGEADFDLAARWARHPRTLCVAGVIDGRIIGAGAASLNDSIASLGGLSVLPEFRRRGVQQALIAERLNLAATRGCTLATIGSRPGQPTERNVRRMGFQLAYTKAHVVMPRPGLVANVG